METDKGLQREILIQFVNHENELTGPVINVPLSITKDNLDELINNLRRDGKSSDKEEPEDQNYSYLVNEQLPINRTLYDAIKNVNISTENTLSIKYVPINVFKVKKINKCSYTLPGHQSSILSIAFSPNSLHLATGSGDNTVRLWDVNTQTPIKTLANHSHWVLVVLFSPDNKFLASASMDSTVNIYDTHTGQLLNTLKGHKKEVTALCFEPLHLLCTEDIKKKPGKAKKRKKGKEEEREKTGKDEEEKEEEEVRRNEKKVKRKDLDANEVAEVDVRLRKRRDDKIENKQKHKEKEIKEGSFCTDKTTSANKKNNNDTDKAKTYFLRSRLASAGKDATIRINDVLSNSVDVVLTGHKDTITCILWSGKNARNSIIYSSSRDKTIKVWDVHRKILIYDFKGHAHWVNCLSLNSEKIIKNGIYNLDLIINKMQIENSIERAQKIYDTFLKNQKYEKVVSGSDDGTLFLIHCLEKKNFKSLRLTGHQKPVICVQFSGDGKLIASSSFDRSIRLWSSDDGKFLAVFRGHVNPVYKTIWSIDNNFLVSCSEDSTIKLWNVSHYISSLENNSPAEPEEKNEKKNDIVIDEKTVAQTDKTIKEKGKDIVNGNESIKNTNDINKKEKKKKDENKKKVKALLVDLPGHDDAIYAIDWSNDGKYLASGGKDKMLKIWSH